MGLMLKDGRVPRGRSLLALAFGILLIASCGSSKRWVVELSVDQTDGRIATIVVSEVGDNGTSSKGVRGVMQGVLLSKAVRIDCGDPKSIDAAGASVLFVDRTIPPGRITLAVDGLIVDVLPARVQVRKGEAVVLEAEMGPSSK